MCLMQIQNIILKYGNAEEGKLGERSHHFTFQPVIIKNALDGELITENW